jgi:hypothetical protein
MNRKARDYFVFSVAVILFVTAATKIFSATGSAEALGHPDPFIPLPNRLVFYLVGGIELFVSGFLLVKHENQRTKLLLIAWLSTNCLVYRIGLWWMGAPNFCDCLGSLNEKLFISPRTLNYVMLVVLAWMIAGSYLLLISDWLSCRKDSGSSTQSGRVKA